MLAREGIAASADPAIVVHFAGRVFARREAEMHADLARFSEAGRIVDRRLEGERREWPDTGHGHEAAAGLILPDATHDHVRQRAELLVNSPPGFKQGCDTRLQITVSGDQLPHARLESRQ